MLEWCSAAEGARWQNTMVEAEKRRQSVTSEELAQTQTALAGVKTPSPRTSRPGDENTEAVFTCVRCGHQWHDRYAANTERTCSQCRSNSVRWLRIKPEISS